MTNYPLKSIILTAIAAVALSACSSEAPAVEPTSTSTSKPVVKQETPKPVKKAKKVTPTATPKVTVTPTATPTRTATPTPVVTPTTQAPPPVVTSSPTVAVKPEGCEDLTISQQAWVAMGCNTGGPEEMIARTPIEEEPPVGEDYYNPNNSTPTEGQTIQTPEPDWEACADDSLSEAEWNEQCFLGE